jgi:hypothetical protein
MSFIFDPILFIFLSINVVIILLGFIFYVLDKQFIITTYLNPIKKFIKILEEKIYFYYLKIIQTINSKKKLRDKKKIKIIKKTWEKEFYQLPYDVLVYILQNFIEIKIYYTSIKMNTVYSFYNDNKWNKTTKHLLFDFYGIFNTDKDRVLRLLFLHVKIINPVFCEKYIPERKLIQNLPNRTLSIHCDCEHTDIKDIILKKCVNKLMMERIQFKYIKDEINKFKYLNCLEVYFKYQLHQVVYNNNIIETLQIRLINPNTIFLILPNLKRCWITYDSYVKFYKFVDTKSLEFLFIWFTGYIKYDTSKILMELNNLENLKYVVSNVLLKTSSISNFKFFRYSILFGLPIKVQSHLNYFLQDK